MSANPDISTALAIPSPTKVVDGARISQRIDPTPSKITVRPATSIRLVALSNPIGADEFESRVFIVEVWLNVEEHKNLIRRTSKAWHP
jgi:hypothetical protein